MMTTENTALERGLGVQQHSRRRVLTTVLVPVLVALGLVVAVAPVAQAEVFVTSTPETAWHVDGKVSAVLTAGGRVFVGGTFGNAVDTRTGRRTTRRNLAAFDARSGALITDWNPGASDTVYALASDGTSLFLGGEFREVAGAAANRIAKVSVATGARVGDFQARTNVDVRSIELSGESLYIGGGFTGVNGVDRNRVAKLAASTGALDPVFDADAEDTVRDVKASPNGSVIYVAGRFDGIDAVDGTTGALIKVFDASTEDTLALDLNEDGSLLFVAAGGRTGSRANTASAFRTGTGVRAWGIRAEGDIQAIDYFRGTVYFGFHDGYKGDRQDTDSTKKVLAADAATGRLDPRFSPSIPDFMGVFALDVGDYGVMVGGEFTSVSGVPAQGWVRFAPVDGAPPAPTAPPVTTAPPSQSTQPSATPTTGKGSTPTAAVVGAATSASPTAHLRLGTVKVKRRGDRLVVRTKVVNAGDQTASSTSVVIRIGGERFGRVKVPALGAHQRAVAKVSSAYRGPGSTAKIVLDPHHRLHQGSSAGYSKSVRIRR